MSETEKIRPVEDTVDALADRVEELEAEAEQLGDELTDATWSRPSGMLIREIEERFPGLKVVDAGELSRLRSALRDIAALTGTPAVLRVIRDALGKKEAG